MPIKFNGFIILLNYYYLLLLFVIKIVDLKHNKHLNESSITNYKTNF
jgi:hypothetical protein